MANRRLDVNQIAQYLWDDDEESAIDSPDENEVETGLIQSDHDSASQESANETDHEWSTDDSEPLTSHVSKNSKNYYTGRDNITKWAKSPPRASVRVRSHNIMRETPGPKGMAREASTKAETFFCMFSRNTIDLILHHANEYIKS